MHFKPIPVSVETTFSPPTPLFKYFFKPAMVAAEVGSMKCPIRPISLRAISISFSVTMSTSPSVSLIASKIWVPLIGFAMAIPSAFVSLLWMGRGSFRPF